MAHELKHLENRLIDQLDSLLPFLAMAHQEVFDFVGGRYADWLPPEQQGTLPDTFALFERQITHGAFLIGYSYFEAYLADVANRLLKISLKYECVYLYNPETGSEARERIGTWFDQYNMTFPGFDGHLVELA